MNKSLIINEVKELQPLNIFSKLMTLFKDINLFLKNILFNFKQFKNIEFIFVT